MGPAADKINIIHFNDVYNIESGDKVRKKRLIFFLKKKEEFEECTFMNHSSKKLDRDLKNCKSS